MDAERFDRLTKTLSTPGTRRVVLRLLATVLLAGRLAQDRQQVLAQGPPFICAEGHPCFNGRQTACCQRGQYCCNRKTDNPVCVARKQDCPV